MRSLIAHLIGAVDELQGQHRLEDAIRYRNRPDAPSDDANLLARQILIDEAGQQGQNFADVKSQLSELATLVELLNGDEQLDTLTDSSRTTSSGPLERLSALMDVFRSDPANHDVLTPQAIHDLWRRDLDMDTFWTMCVKAFRSLRADCLRFDPMHFNCGVSARPARSQPTVSEIEQAPSGSGQSTHGVADAPAQELALGNIENWREMSVWGGLCLAMILQWLAILISRGIHGQTVQGLTLEKQTAVAELDKVNKKLLEISQRARCGRSLHRRSSQC